MQQYCSVCKDYFDMEVVEEGGENEVTWLRCPSCHGILPYMELEEKASGEDQEQEEFSANSFDDEDVVEYDARGSFEVGHVIYHRSWNDYGRVLEKLGLPGNRHAIRVQFLQQGDVQLLEMVQDDS